MTAGMAPALVKRPKVESVRRYLEVEVGRRRIINNFERPRGADWNRGICSAVQRNLAGCRKRKQFRLNRGRHKTVNGEPEKYSF